MKLSKKLRKYFRKRNSNIGLLLQKPEHAFSVSDFHELRVEIKKVKALLKFTDFCSDNFKRKAFFKPYKIVFKKAGNVRELQLEEKELRKEKNVRLHKGYFAHLKNLKTENRKAFFACINPQLKTQLENSIDKVKPFLSRAGKKKASIYLEKKGKQIEKLSDKKQLKEKNLHELRKYLKTFSYTRKMLDKNLPDKKLNKSENFQELLGKWHDKETIIGHLEKINNSSKIKPDELKQLRKIKTKYVQEKELLFKKIDRIIRAGNGKITA